MTHEGDRDNHWSDSARGLVGRVDRPPCRQRGRRPKAQSCGVAPGDYVAVNDYGATRLRRKWRTPGKTKRSRKRSNRLRRRMLQQRRNRVYRLDGADTNPLSRCARYYGEVSRRFGLQFCGSEKRTDNGLPRAAGALPEKLREWRCISKSFLSTRRSVVFTFRRSGASFWNSSEAASKQIRLNKGLLSDKWRDRCGNRAHGFLSRRHTIPNCHGRSSR